MKQRIIAAIWKTRELKHPIRIAKRKKNTKNEVILRGFWDNIKPINNHIIKLAEEEEGDQGIEQLFQDIIMKTPLM